MLMPVKSPYGDEPIEPPVRRGAVAVIVRDGRLLVIERSAHVAAPGAFCFPGGGIEQGEDEPAALVRELREELGIVVEPVARLWTCTTAWNVELHWWLAHLAADAAIAPNLAEVAAYHWHTVAELRALPRLLSSNREFLDAWEQRVFTIAGLSP
jgi:8-oxo-dGTP pyrophosphatase MutT (NUDIX family)